MAGVAAMRNAGPAFAAVGIGYANDPQILAALNGTLLVALVVALPAAPPGWGPGGAQVRSWALLRSDPVRRTSTDP